MSPAQRFVLLVALLGWTLDAGAQWTNRYPKVTGFNHHVYLEGYDMPVVSVGRTDPAPSPDDRWLAFASRGWLWIQDLTTGEARRLTRGAALDARPAWSPDGRTIAFVRDDTKDTSLVSIDVASGEEKVLVDTDAIDLDPVYARDGRSLFYASAIAGDLDLYRLDLATGATTRLTEDRGNELRPQPLPGDDRVVFLAKQGSRDTVNVLTLGDRSRRTIAEGAIASQMRPAADPSGRLVVVNVPDPDGWALWLYDVEGGPPIQLTRGRGMPIMAAWGGDGSMVYFVESDDSRTFQIARIARVGGLTTPVPTLAWTWGEPTARLRIRTTQGTAPRPSRLHVADRDGHPVLPDSGPSWFDGQNGLAFFYSPGTIELEVPAGTVHIQATAGFTTPLVTATAQAKAGEVVTTDLTLAPLANPQADGWYSGDLHFHLNYGGPYALDPPDLLPMMRGEDLDVATPLMANLHTRVLDREWFSWSHPTLPIIQFGQEIRPHFLGHTGAIGIATPYFPWFWGPGYPVFGRDDRPGGDALTFVKRQGGVNAYVHPVSRPGPFTPGQPPTGLPLALVPDALAGDVDTIEVACLWSDELGTSDAWYRLLNVGIPIAPSAGTDVMTNFHRTMAVGTTRVFVKVDGPLTIGRYLESLRAGRSYVTSGPLLTFSAMGSTPGGTIAARTGVDVPWQLTVTSPIAFETVEILVNGQVAWTGKGLAAAGRQTWSGTVKAPAGGWIAARVRGGSIQWPAMDSYPFAHTGAIWFSTVGSIDPDAARAAARDLLAWMDVADKRLADGYTGADIPRLKERFAAARRRLDALAAGRP